MLYEPVSINAYVEDSPAFFQHSSDKGLKQKGFRGVCIVHTAMSRPPNWPWKHQKTANMFDPVDLPRDMDLPVTNQICGMPVQPFGLLGYSAHGSGQAQRLIPWVPGGKKTLVRNCAFKRSMPLCLPCKQITNDSTSSHFLHRCAAPRPRSLFPRIGCIGSAHSNGGTWVFAFHDFGRGCGNVPEDLDLRSCSGRTAHRCYQSSE